MNYSKRAQTAEADAHIGRTVRAMLLFLVVGISIVLFDWRVLEQVLVGKLHLPAIAIALVLAVVFVACAWVLGRHIRALLPPEA